MAGYLDDDVYAVVLDCGSGMCKAGFAGDDAPRAVFPTCVGHSAKQSIFMGADQKDQYVGDAAISRRDKLELHYPMEHGVVVDWADMETVWKHALQDELRVDTSSQPVLLTEPVHNPAANREHATQVMFEKLNTPGFYIATQAILSVYASGRGTCLMCESGDGVTHVLPVYEGYTVPHSMQRIDMGGRDLTRYLAEIIRDKGFSFSTTAELDIVREMKEKLCFVSTEPVKEQSSGVPCPEKSFQLPDGNIVLGKEMYQCPEALFQPSLLGKNCMAIHEAMFDCLQRCDVDMRRDLCVSLFLSGGNTMFSGLADRLQAEMISLVPCRMRVKVIAPPERKVSAWIGGSILASLSTFQQNWITRAEYEEFGPRIVHRKCVS